MNLGEVLKSAWKSLLSNKLRSLLTMLGVIIGVTAVIVMIAISAGTEATISDAITGLGSNLVFISGSITRGGPNMRVVNQSGGGAVFSPPSTGLVYDDADAIRERVNGVAGVSVEQQTTVSLKYENTTLEDITMLGATPDYPTVRDFTIAAGRFYTQSDMDKTAKVIVLGAAIKEQLFGEADAIGQNVMVNNTRVTVVGVLAKKGLVAGTDYDQLIYTPITVILKKFTGSMFARFMGDSVRQIIVSVEPEADMDAVIQQINLLLIKRHEVTLDTADFTIRTQADIIETQESTTASFRTLLAWVAGVSLIVGGIGIMNIMLVSVTERTREIGLRQAIGATPGDIQVQFLTEALMLSLLGGVLGILVGIGGAVLFGELSGMRTVIAPYSIALSFTSAALIGIFFGYVPAHQAATLDPIVALRHE